MCIVGMAGEVSLGGVFWCGVSPPHMYIALLALLHTSADVNLDSDLRSR